MDMDPDAIAQRQRMNEQREFWRAYNFRPPSIPVHAEDKAEVDALIKVKTGERLLAIVKNTINVRDFEPFRHRKHLAMPHFADVAALRKQMGELKNCPAKLRKRFEDFEELFVDLYDYHRIVTQGDGSDFALKQAWSMRFALSYIVDGEYYLLRKDINDRPVKTPDSGQPDVFDTEPRPEFLETGDGEDVDGLGDV